MEQGADSKKCTFSIDRGGTFTDIYAEVQSPLFALERARESERNSLSLSLTHTHTHWGVALLGAGSWGAWLPRVQAAFSGPWQL